MTDITEDADITRTLTFWVEEVGPEGWYKQSDAVDAACAARFGDLLDKARMLRGWLSSARGALAYLILTDQFSRNIHRGTAGAFAADPLARSAAMIGLERGFDRVTPEPQRQFFYLPFMHAESLTDQGRSVRLILTRMPETGAENLRHAIQHRAVIRQFGRFPSRNAALGRTDTAAELAYRAAGGYMS